MHINSQWDGLKCLLSFKAIDFVFVVIVVVAVVQCACSVQSLAASVCGVPRWRYYCLLFFPLSLLQNKGLSCPSSHHLFSLGMTGVLVTPFRKWWLWPLLCICLVRVSDILQSVWDLVIDTSEIASWAPSLSRSHSFILVSFAPSLKTTKTHTLRNVRHIANYYEPQPRLSLSYCCLDSERVCNFQLAL